MDNKDKDRKSKGLYNITEDDDFDMEKTHRCATLRKTESIERRSFPVNRIEKEDISAEPHSSNARQTIKEGKVTDVKGDVPNTIIPPLKSKGTHHPTKGTIPISSIHKEEALKRKIKIKSPSSTGDINTGTLFICKICKREYTKKIRLEKHIERLHKIKTNIKYIRNLKKFIPFVKRSKSRCTICGLLCVNLNRHVNLMHSRRAFKCPFCRFRTSNGGRLTIHIRNVHNKEGKDKNSLTSKVGLSLGNSASCSKSRKIRIIQNEEIQKKARDLIFNRFRRIGAGAKTIKKSVKSSRGLTANIAFAEYAKCFIIGAKKTKLLTTALSIDSLMDNYETSTDMGWTSIIDRISRVQETLKGKEDDFIRKKFQYNILQNDEEVEHELAIMKIVLETDRCLNGSGTEFEHFRNALQAGHSAMPNNMCINVERDSNFVLAMPVTDWSLPANPSIELNLVFAILKGSDGSLKVMLRESDEWRSYDQNGIRIIDENRLWPLQLWAEVYSSVITLVYETRSYIGQSGTSLISDYEYENVSQPICRTYNHFSDSTLVEYRKRIMHQKEIEPRIKEEILQRAQTLYRQTSLENIDSNEKHMIVRDLNNRALEAADGTTIGIFRLSSDAILSLELQTGSKRICSACFVVMPKHQLNPQCYNCSSHDVYVGVMRSKSKKVSHGISALLTAKRGSQGKDVEKAMKTKFSRLCSSQLGIVIHERDRPIIMNIFKFPGYTYELAMAQNAAYHIWEWAKMRFILKTKEKFFMDRVKISYGLSETFRNSVSERFIKIMQREGYKITMSRTDRSHDMSKEDIQRLNFRPFTNIVGGLRAGKARHAIYALCHLNQNRVYYGRNNRADLGGAKSIFIHHMGNRKCDQSNLMSLHVNEPPLPLYVFVTNRTEVVGALESYAQFAGFLGQTLGLSHVTLKNPPVLSNSYLELKGSKESRGWEHDSAEVLNVLLHHEFGVKFEINQCKDK